MRDPISNERLALCHPSVAARANAAESALATATGIYFRVAQGLRTYTQQQALFNQGRTLPGDIVTNAPAGYSNHNFGMAIDCYPFAAGFSGNLIWDHTSPEFASMVAALIAEGFVWGGDWIHIKDYPHFQLPGVPVTPTGADRAAFAAGGLAAVWAQYPGI